MYVHAFMVVIVSEHVQVWAWATTNVLFKYHYTRNI